MIKREMLDMLMSYSPICKEVKMFSIATGAACMMLEGHTTAANALLPILGNKVTGIVTKPMVFCAMTGALPQIVHNGQSGKQPFNVDMGMMCAVSYGLLGAVVASKLKPLLA